MLQARKRSTRAIQRADGTDLEHPGQHWRVGGMLCFQQGKGFSCEQYFGSIGGLRGYAHSLWGIATARRRGLYRGLMGLI